MFSEILSHAEISFAGITKYRDDRLIAPQLGRYALGCSHVRAGRNSSEQTFLARQDFRGAIRLVVRDGNYPVKDLLIQDVRHKSRTDTLNLVRSRSASRKNRR